MHIAIGSTNNAKVQAVEEVIKEFPQLAEATIQTFSVPSEISEQPMSLEEIIQGAKNRAHNAFAISLDCSLAFGIESGLFEALGSRTGFLEACICCVYDGKEDYIGLSCGFEVPPQILDLVLNEKIDLGQACLQSGITTNAKLGSAEGFIGMLTKGKITRKEYTKQCVITAMSQFDNAQWYLHSPQNR